MKDEYYVLKDGTKVRADDFWLSAPTWFIEKFAEPIPNGRERPTPRDVAKDAS